MKYLPNKSKQIQANMVKHQTIQNLMPRPGDLKVDFIRQQKKICTALKNLDVYTD